MRRGHAAAVTVIVILALTVPVVVPALTRHVVSSSDWALIELRTRDVFSAHPPQLGPYSRYGWAHPGPLMYFLFALPYRVLGSDARAMQLAAVLVNMAVIVAIASLARRRGRLAFAAVMVAVCALVFGSPPHSLVDSWNVSIAVLPFLLTLVACWGAMCRDRHAMAAATVSFAVVFQSHIGFGLVLTPLVGITAATGAWRWWRARVEGTEQPRTEQPRTTTILLWAGVTAVLFAPVLYDTLARWPGNIGRLARWSLSNDEPTSGLPTGLRIVARASSASFLRHPGLDRAYGGLVDPSGVGVLPGLLLVLLVLCGLWTWRRAQSAEALLCAGILVTWMAGLVAAANVAGPLYSWLLEWLQPLAWLSWAAVAMVACRALLARMGQAEGRARFVVRATWVGSGLAAVALAVGAVGYTVDAARSAYLNAELVAPVEQFASAAGVVGNDRAIRIEFAGDIVAAGALHAGIVNELDRAGFDVCVAPNLSLQYGASRVCAGRPDEYLLVRAESRLEPLLPGASLLATSDPLTDDERAEADRLTDDLAALLVANGRPDEVPLLSTRFAVAVLNDDPPPAVVDRAVDVMRLGDLRQAQGQRFTLQLVPTTSP